MTGTRQLLAFGLLALALAAHDFATRIYVGRDEALRRFTAPSPLRLTTVADPGSARARLAEWLPATALKGSVPDDAGGWDLRLAGIFTRKGERFAVVLTTPRAGGPVERTKLAVGDAVKGYRLREIGKRDITLEGADGPRHLMMFDRQKKT